MLRALHEWTRLGLFRTMLIKVMSSHLFDVKSGYGRERMPAGLADQPVPDALGPCVCFEREVDAEDGWYAQVTYTGFLLRLRPLVHVYSRLTVAAIVSDQLPQVAVRLSARRVSLADACLSLHLMLETKQPVTIHLPSNRIVHSH